MREIHPAVSAAPEECAHAPESTPSAIGSPLVVSQHRGDRGMMLQQTSSSRRGDHIDRPMLLGETGEQRRGENDVAQERGLDDEGGRSVGRSVGHLLTEKSFIAASLRGYSVPDRLTA